MRVASQVGIDDMAYWYMQSGTPVYCGHHCIAVCTLYCEAYWYDELHTAYRNIVAHQYIAVTTVLRSVLYIADVASQVRIDDMQAQNIYDCSQYRVQTAI